VRWLLRRDILGVAGRASGSDVQQLGSASWVPFDRRTWRHLFFRNRPFRREIYKSSWTGSIRFSIAETCPCIIQKRALLPHNNEGQKPTCWNKQQNPLRKKEEMNEIEILRTLKNVRTHSRNIQKWDNVTQTAKWNKNTGRLKKVKLKHWKNQLNGRKSKDKINKKNKKEHHITTWHKLANGNTKKWKNRVGDSGALTIVQMFLCAVQANKHKMTH